MLDDRVQFTIGARHQTAGSEVTVFLGPPGSASRPEHDSSVWSPAYAVVVKPVEHISLYANYIEGLQTPVVVGPLYANAGTVFPPSQT
jgi:iron complex outermembrane receptor protein